MSILDRLRPDLASLMKQDPKSSPKTPLESPAVPPRMTDAEEREAFAEQVSAQHAIHARDAKLRPSSLEGPGEPELLEPKPRRTRHVVRKDF